MQFEFSKYQGAGNDFILVDQRTQDYGLDAARRAWLCHRRFGIGADGLILLENAPGYSFRMVYFNSDGNPSTLCGNGGRCIAAFARDLGIELEQGEFIAVDGPHRYAFDAQGRVHLHMPEVESITWGEDYAILDTGSPHFVQWVGDLAHLQRMDVHAEGRQIRYSPSFEAKGINVNFAVRDQVPLPVRTYERGVEAETLACGTGVTAAAIASVGTQLGTFHQKVRARGGDLEVHFEKVKPDAAHRVVLIGPAQKVFEGRMPLSAIPSHFPNTNL